LICSEVAASFAHFSSAKERRIIQRSIMESGTAL
jgi:hypothetical protein